MNEGLSWKAAITAWHRFFLYPRHTLPCDIVRVGYGLLILIMCLTTWHQVDMLWAESGLLPHAISREFMDSDLWSIFDILPKTDETTQICFAILTIQTVFLVIGLYCRFQAISIYILLVSFQNRNLLLLDSEDAVFRMVGLLLIFMPLGKHLSLRTFWREKKAISLNSPEASCWALRLLQVEMCLVFLSASFSKLNSSDWLDGTALYYTSRLDDYFGRFPTPAFLWESMWIMAIMGWAVIALEALVPILVWFKETRRLALILAALFHLACDYTMNLYMFHWIMLVGWCSFLTGFDKQQTGFKHESTNDCTAASVLSSGFDST